VGNRLKGERLASIVDHERRKLAAGSVLLSPFVPLLFMGEEYGEPAPFLYFVSHGDPPLVEAVRRGRKEEFAAFGWDEEPPDPQAEETFRRSGLDHGLRERGEHQALYAFHSELLRLRGALPALRRLSKDQMEVARFEHERTLRLRRFEASNEVVILLHFGPAGAEAELPAGRFLKVLDSAEERWGGPGSPAPARVDSDRAARVGLAPWSVVAFSAEERLR
jgi:maltooligosyltrehalose trehalohydrolase